MRLTPPETHRVPLRGRMPHRLRPYALHRSPAAPWGCPMTETERERLTTILALDVRASAMRADTAETAESAADWRLHAAVSALLLAMLVTGRGVASAAVWLAWRGGVLWGRASR